MRIGPFEIEALGLGGSQHATPCTATTTMPSPPVALLVLPEAAVQLPADLHFDDSQADRLSLSDASVGLGDPEGP